MKNLIVIASVLGLVGSSFGDIQDPPANDYGPTRKLGRGLSNFFLAPAEIPVTVAKINEDEGNAAAFGYGVVRGIGRARARHIAGFLEIVLWPFPAWRERVSARTGQRIEVPLRARLLRSPRCGGASESDPPKFH